MLDILWNCVDSSNIMQKTKQKLIVACETVFVEVRGILINDFLSKKRKKLAFVGAVHGSGV